jgi:DNA invertase Pin-like site-specific DNA recombinase
MVTVIPLPRSEAQQSRLRAGLYGRASKDRHLRGRSIRDQFAVAEMECEERGWRVVDRYEDRDRSATRKATKVREQFERLVSDAESGKLDVIVYAERSRISRNLNVSLQLRDLCLRTGVLLCYDGRVYDMRIGPDFKEFTRDAVQSEEEGEVIIARNQRTARLQAKRGAPAGRVPFGYKREYDPNTGELVGQVPHPEEAPVVVQLFEQFARDKSIRSLMPLIDPLSTMGVTGVRAILLNKAYIGIRVHGAEEYEAEWDAIVGTGLFWRVRAILDDPQRRTSRNYDVRHLLSGIAMCAECRSAGKFVLAKMKRISPQPSKQLVSRYRCSGLCLTIVQANLDAYVEESVLAWLGSEAAREAFRQDDGLDELGMERARYQAMSNQLAEARDQASTFDDVTGLPGLSAASLAALEKKVIPLLKASEVRMRQLMASGDPVVDQLLQTTTRTELDEIWEERLTVAQQRHVIRNVVRVEVRRAGKGGSRKPVGDRVKLVFFGEPGFKEWPQVVTVGTDAEAQ